MSQESGFKLAPGIFGTRLNLFHEWNDLLAASLEGVYFDEIAFRFAPKLSIEFLRLYPHLKGIQVYSNGVDLSPIMSLNELRWIYLDHFGKSTVDFASFPLLEDCSIFWTSKVTTALKVKTLARLTVKRLPKGKIALIRQLPELQDLSIFGCGSISLDELRGCKSIRKLRINQFNRLESYGFLEDMSNLEELSIELSGRIHNLSPLSNLKNLHTLELWDVGPIESLAPLQNLDNLQRLIIGGGNNTHVVDGDMSDIRKLPKLEWLSVSGVGGIDWRTLEAEEKARKKRNQILAE